VAEDELAHSGRQDQALLARLEDADLAATSTSWPRKGRARHLRYPPSYVVLDAARPRRGKVLHYDR